MTVSRVLRGTQPGQLQSVGLMQVVPLLSDIEDDRFVSPDEAEVGTSSYGTLAFKNLSARTLLVPCHAAYVVPEAAQDHAMAHLGLVKKKRTASFDTAMCVQAGQGGTIRRDKRLLMILPFALRERALAVRGERAYNKLWDEISAFNERFGLSAAGHIEYFLKAFSDQLDHFVAEFECVPRQVGAIILVNGSVVGVEKAPSCAYWRSVWRSLIRECYGSLAIEWAQKLGDNPPALRTRTPLMGEPKSLKELEELLAETRRREEACTRQIVRELLGDPFVVSAEETVDGFQVETLQHEQLTGQIVREADRIHYASLVVRRDWLEDAAWAAAEDFSI
jgi:hypothetical protein